MVIRSVLPILFALVGCVTQPISVDTIYRKDMELKVDGVDYRDGAIVLDRKPSYDIKAYFYKRADKFVVTTCHRHLVWSSPGDDVSFKYLPDPDLEQNADEICPLECGAFDSAGQHSWCYIDFRSTENLSAHLSCNGDKNRPVWGVSICQAKTHLIQKISFDVTVSSVSSQGCPDLQTTDNRTFIIETGTGKCFYLFQNGKDFHRLTVFGYDDVMLR